jgi:hypothetical protein
MVGIRFVAEVFVQGNQLKVALSFWEHIGAFSGNLSFSLENLVSVKTTEKLDLNSLGLRVGGTGLPGIAVLGHFRKKGKRIFCNWTKGQKILCVELRNSKFDRLELGCTNPEALEEELANYLPV